MFSWICYVVVGCLGYVPGICLYWKILSLGTKQAPTESRRAWFSSDEIFPFQFYRLFFHFLGRPKSGDSGSKMRIWSSEGEPLCETQGQVSLIL